MIKKSLYIIIILIMIMIFTLSLFIKKREINDLATMNISDNYNGYYELNFENENLNFDNFKLKMAIFFFLWM